jgi:hypothetical protein
MKPLDLTHLRDLPYAKLDQIASRAGYLACKNCDEPLKDHAGLRCLFDNRSTFENLSILTFYHHTDGCTYTFEECAKIIAEVNRRDQERWQSRNEH